MVDYVGYLSVQNSTTLSSDILNKDKLVVAMPWYYFMLGAVLKKYTFFSNNNIGLNSLLDSNLLTTVALARPIPIY